MSEQPLLSFPCEMPIKVFGRNTDTFRESAIEIVRAHFEGIDDSLVREQISKQGRFLSLTISVTATSREQLDRAYLDLTRSDGVLMVL